MHIMLSHEISIIRFRQKKKNSPPIKSIIQNLIHLLHISLKETQRKSPEADFMKFWILDLNQ